MKIEKGLKTRCDKCFYWDIIDNEKIQKNRWIGEISFSFCKRYPNNNFSEFDTEIIEFWKVNNLDRLIRISKSSPLKGYDDWCGEFVKDFSK